MDCAAKLKLRLVGLYFLNSFLSCNLYLVISSISEFLVYSSRLRCNSASKAL